MASPEGRVQDMRDVMDIQAVDQTTMRVVLVGRLDTPTIERIEPGLRARIRDSRQHVIVDLYEVGFAASLAIRMFVVIARQLQGTGRKIVLFGAQILFGLLAGFQYLQPDFLYGVVDFSVNRMVHINAMVVWMLFGFIGSIYWLIEDESGTEIVGLKLGNLAFKITHVPPVLLRNRDGQLFAVMSGKRASRELAPQSLLLFFQKAELLIKTVKRILVDAAGLGRKNRQTIPKQAQHNKKPSEICYQAVHIKNTNYGGT